MAKTPDKNDEPKTKTKEPEAPVNTAAEPYPTGNPPDPEDQFEAAHGFRRTPKKEG